MKQSLRFTVSLVLTLLIVAASCAWADEPPVDHAGTVSLNRASDTVKLEVRVRTFVDGDTTHFYVPSDVVSTGVLKARYLAVNTPEISGRVEEYGKKAAAFTKEKLEHAVSILIESDDARWNLDSTGERHLVWVWYQSSKGEAYRNLNIELLQNGLALPNSAANNRYGSACMAAAAQARALKLNVYSGQRDPDFYYGDAIELTLKELRCNISAYSGKRVAFTGIVTMNDGASVFMEAYDAETGRVYGISVYYGYGLTGDGLAVLKVGNESRIVGVVQYYEAGGTYQVSDLRYRLMKPKDPGNIQKLSEGHVPIYAPTDIQAFTRGRVDVALEDETKTFDYAALALCTSVEIKNLTVIKATATRDLDSASFGALTLTCESDGCTVKVRTIPLHDEHGALVTADAYQGKMIDVRGIVEYSYGEYQIKVFMSDGIAIHP